MNARYMSSCISIGVLVLSAAILPVAAYGEVDLVLDIRPGAVLFGGGGDFKAIGPTERTVKGQTLTEIEKLGGVSTFPNLKLGAGIERPNAFLDIMGGGGVMVNDPFRSYFLGVDASFQYKYRKNVAVGPRIGLMYFTEPEWAGDAEVEFSDSWGAIIGLEMTLGYDILFVFSVDYLYTNPFEAKPLGAWDISDTELDLSGIALEFGMRGRF